MVEETYLSVLGGAPDVHRLVIHLQVSLYWEGELNRAALQKRRGYSESQYSYRYSMVSLPNPDLTIPRQFPS